MDAPGLRRLFSACDVNKSGEIEYEDFTAVCRELRVPEGDVAALFARFGAERDGRINYADFSSKFREVSETLDLTAFGAAEPRRSSGTGPWDQFLERNDSALPLLLLRTRLAGLYQAIVDSANGPLLTHYEVVLNSLISESVDHKMETEQLESTLKRTENMNNSQLEELEEDIQKQLAAVEQQVRDEERKKMEELVASMQRRHENEVADLHASLKRLVKSQEDAKQDHSKKDITRLKRDIFELTQENDRLQSALLTAQTDISVLHLELDKLKNMYTDQELQHHRERDDLKRMVIEYQSYSNQIQALQEMNKELYDSNDGLRSALANEAVATKRRLSPKNEIPARRMKPIRQSTMNQSNSEQNPGTAAPYHHVTSWADKYLDSGVALPTDTVALSDSDADSNDSRDSMETVHHSYSYVPSDMEVSEVKSEAAMSITPSITSSSVSMTLRRRLSAFSIKPDILTDEGPSPIYRLVLAGDAGAGKSSFLLRLTLNEFRGDMQTTLGVDFQLKKMLVDGERTTLQIWDTAGQERHGKNISQGKSKAKDPCCPSCF
ncbi:Ras and EF-hand domain-containing protein [Merluccius polli]|uniref:Ras and EF-hand domain-containing protein n=1 Tax=Merluccius polli TaxID=89951 RepID=A0AA47NBB2_MERPO|nr:Ras and EF-hand domain-containing protein [Merluccius polli]